MKSWNIRARLALLCAMFIVPLALVMLLHGQRVQRDFAVLGREVDSVRALGEAWKAADRGPDTGRRVRELAVRDLILDDHPDAYPLAHALSAGLLDLALRGRAAGDAEVARGAMDAADDLLRAAEATRPGAMRSGLMLRAAELRSLAANPQRASTAQSNAWWSATLSDLDSQLAARRQSMIQQEVLQLSLIAAFVAAAGVMAWLIAHGLSQRAAVLGEAIDRLIRNDTAGVTPFLDDPHEMGRLAKGVEALRQSITETRAAWGEVLLNETRYSLIAENMREVVLLTDLEGGILFASPSAEAICGDVEALEGARVWDLFAQADARPLREGAGSLVAGELARPRCQMNHDGSAWDVILRRSADEDDSVLFVLTPPMAASQLN